MNLHFDFVSNRTCRSYWKTNMYIYVYERNAVDYVKLLEIQQLLWTQNRQWLNLKDLTDVFSKYKTTKADNWIFTNLIFNRVSCIYSLVKMTKITFSCFQTFDIISSPTVDCLQVGNIVRNNWYFCLFSLIKLKIGTTNANQQRIIF